MSAYLVAYLQEKDGKAVLLGLDIFSEAEPTVEGRRKTALVLTWPGDTYAEAKASLLDHLAKVRPWLLPERNGGRR